MLARRHPAESLYAQEAQQARLGDPHTAERRYADAVLLDPNGEAAARHGARLRGPHPTTVELRAHLAARQHDIAEAATLYRCASDAYATNGRIADAARCRFRGGVHLMQQGGATHEALVCLTRAVTWEPNRHEFWHALGVGHTLRARALAPNDPQAHHHGGRALIAFTSANSLAPRSLYFHAMASASAALGLHRVAQRARATAMDLEPVADAPTMLEVAPADGAPVVGPRGTNGFWEKT